MPGAMAVKQPFGPDTGLKPLCGPDKAAALLLVMGKPAAANLMKHFDAAELKLISRAAAKIGPISAAEMEALIEEFASQFSDGADLQGTARSAEKLLTGVLPPEQVAEIMSDILGGSAESVWDRLAVAPDAAIVSFVEKEHPQVAAFILSRTKPAVAAKVMSQLPQQLRNELVRRMLTSKPVPDSAARIVEATLRDDFLNKARSSVNASLSRLADIVSKMDRDPMEDMLQGLAQVKPEMAETLKSMLFRFEDIVKLSPKGRMTLFDSVPAEQVVLSLKGTEAEFRELVLSSLGARARRIVQAELNSGEASPQRDVMDARRAIADLALAMAGRGELDLTASESKEAVLQ